VRSRTAVWLLTLLLLGGHVGLIQVVAWASMLAERAPQQGLAAAARSTFDGSAPCPLCRMAKELRDDPQPAAPQPKPTSAKKAPEQPPPTWALLDMAGTAVQRERPAAGLAPTGRMPAPEPPPPRNRRG